MPIDDLNVTATELAKMLGRSRTDLVHTVRLLDLPDQAIDLIDRGALTKGPGKALLTAPDHHRRRVLAERAAPDQWSIRMLETEIARRSEPRPKPQPPHPDHEAAAARLQDALTTAAGCEAVARPHRLGYQVILDHAAGERLIRFYAKRRRHRKLRRACHVAHRLPRANDEATLEARRASRKERDLLRPTRLPSTGRVCC